jgi:hypothetical protein
MYPTLLGEPPLLAGELIVLRRCADKYGMKAKPDSRRYAIFQAKTLSSYVFLASHKSRRRPENGRSRPDNGPGRWLSGAG